MSDPEAKRRVVAAQSSDHPARQQIAGQVDELVAAEKQADAEIERLEASKQKAREKFRQETQVEPSRAEQLNADMENDIERNLHYQNEHDAKLWAKKLIEDESNRDQIIEEVVVLAERAKQLKNRAKLRDSISEPIKKLQDGILGETHANSSKKKKVKLTLPLQFDYANKILVDRDRQPSIELPLRFVDVLRAWFDHDGANQKKLKLKLSYVEIGTRYFRGRIKKKAPSGATEADITFREEALNSGKADTHAKSKEKYATRFATDFTRWLKTNHAVLGNELFFNDEVAQQYVIKRSGWHKTRPMINRAEETKRPHYKSHSQKDGDGAHDD
jgi:hypothetical protein